MIFFIIGGALCLLNHFKFQISTNQEFYMGLAKWWADPTWIPNSFLLSDSAGTRIGLNVIMAPFWKLGSFETVTLTATFINLFLIGGAIFLLAKEIRKPSIIAIVLFHLITFSGLGDKSFYSGEWIYGGAEPKTISYFFVLLSVLFFTRKKFIPSMLLLAIGGYFHALIAGWVLLIYLIDNLLKDGFKVSFKNGLIFVISISPFVAYMLLSSWFQKGVESYAQADSIFISNIYFHLKPWLIPGEEYRFYTGLTLAFLCAVVAFFRQKSVTDTTTATLYRLSIYSFMIPAFLVILAQFEWFNPFLKLFPFRLTMMQKLLFFIPLIMEIALKLEKTQFTKQIMAVLVAVFVITGFMRINKNIVQRWPQYQDKSVVKIAEILIKHYSPGTSVAYLDAGIIKPDDKLDPLGRMARVNVFYANKFMPFSPEKLVEWDRRKKITQEIQEDISKLSLLKNENIEVVISKRELPLELVEEWNEYKIYRF